MIFCFYNVLSNQCLRIRVPAIHPCPIVTTSCMAPGCICDTPRLLQRHCKSKEVSAESSHGTLITSRSQFEVKGAFQMSTMLHVSLQFHQTCLLVRDYLHHTQKQNHVPTLLPQPCHPPFSGSTSSTVYTSVTRSISCARRNLVFLISFHPMIITRKIGNSM